MKSLNLLLAGALTLGLWSCSSDEPAPDKGKQEGTKGDVFATLTLDMSKSRSETNTEDDNKDHPAESTNGFEIGKDYENNVDQICVVLATLEDGVYKYLTSTVSNSVLNQAAKTATFTIPFQSQALADYVQNGAKDAYVFTFCNPPSELTTKLAALTKGAEFTDLVYAIQTENEAKKGNLPIAQRTKFLMSNALLASATIPAYQTLVSSHNTVATAFDLGVVAVERSVCRFDFMQKKAGTYTWGENDVNSIVTGANQYVIKDNASGLPVAKVEINGMSLFNEAKDFYYLPRMSKKDDWSAPELCGYELVTSYVVSPNYTAKATYLGNGDYSSIAPNYYFNIGKKPSEYEYDFTFGDPDNTGWTGYQEGYHIWRYATENTMSKLQQKHGITTGVLFRAQILPLDAADIKGHEAGAVHPATTLAAALATGETIYAFTQSDDEKDPQVNIMLGTAKDVYAYAYTHKASTIRNNFIEAVAAGYFKVKIDGVEATTEQALFPAVVENGTYPTFADLLAKVEAEGPAANMTKDDSGEYSYDKSFNFMAYSPDKDGNYYVYYYYYNKHNYNETTASKPEMGVMEFATVRNNIYKLKVDNVNGFGQPGDVVPDPSTDDRTPEVYFQVSCRVLDWVVRVNNIIL